MKEKIKGFSDTRLVGREVYVRDMKMVVSGIDSYCTTCKMKDGYDYTFRHDGRYHEVYLLPTLSFTPYTVTIGDNGQVTIKGYSDEIELESEDEPKVGDCGWFFNKESINFRHGRLSFKDVLGYHCGNVIYKNFSKECPNWIKEIVNK